MVQRCCVPLCGTKVGDRDIIGTKVRFHRMPTTADRFSNWQDKITDSHRFRPILSVNSRVCSKHFLKEDYIFRIVDCASSTNGMPLKKEAVPTRFKWNVDNYDVSATNLPSIRSSGVSLVSHVVDDERSSGEDVRDVPDVLEASAVLSPALDTMYNNDSSEEANAHENSKLSKRTHNETAEERGENSLDCNVQINEETQCSLDDEKMQSELYRKNTIIKQLLNKINDLEEEQKLMEEVITELRAANESSDNQIHDLNRRNRHLEESHRKYLKFQKKSETNCQSSSNSDANRESVDLYARDEECGFPKEKRGRKSTPE